MLESRGYYLRHKSVLPYGMDYIRDIFELSKRFKLPIKTVFDVGAHFGETSQRALNAFPGCRVVAFEPAPESIRALDHQYTSSVTYSHSNKDEYDLIRRRAAVEVMGAQELTLLRRAPMLQLETL